MAEIELGALIRRCLNPRIPDADALKTEVAICVLPREAANSRIEWHFTTGHTRIKLKRLHPTLRPAI